MQEEAGGNEDGGADEGGEEGAVDGLSSWPWLGEKREMPWIVMKKQYIPKNNFYVHETVHCKIFRIKCWKKN